MTGLAGPRPRTVSERHTPPRTADPQRHRNYLLARDAAREAESTSAPQWTEILPEHKYAGISVVVPRQYVVVLVGTSRACCRSDAVQGSQRALSDRTYSDCRSRLRRARVTAATDPSTVEFPVRREYAVAPSGAPPDQRCQRVNVQLDAFSNQYQRQQTRRSARFGTKRAHVQILSPRPASLQFRGVIRGYG